jgi:hypothetical protein
VVVATTTNATPTAAAEEVAFGDRIAQTVLSFLEATTARATRTARIRSFFIAAS